MLNQLFSSCLDTYDKGVVAENFREISAILVNNQLEQMMSPRDDDLEESERVCFF